jgi:hypothetical protein
VLQAISAPTAIVFQEQKMPEDPQETIAPVETGFGDLAAPAPQLAPAPTAEEVATESLALEQEKAQRLAVKAAAEAEERASAQRAEVPEGTTVDLRSEAQKINDQIHKRIIEARMEARKAEEPKPPQPVHQHIMEQTKREMEEGAKQSKFHADQRAAAHHKHTPRSATMSPVPVPEGSTPVFRPDDYVTPTIAGVPRKA